MRTGSCWTTARTCVTAWTCPVRAATSRAPNVAPKSVALSVDVAGSGSTNMWKLKGQIWYWNGRSLKIRTSGDVHKALNLKSKWQLEGRKESWRSLKWLTNWRSVERNFMYRGVQESLKGICLMWMFMHLFLWTMYFKMATGCTMSVTFEAFFNTIINQHHVVCYQFLYWLFFTWVTKNKNKFTYIKPECQSFLR